MPPKFEAAETLSPEAGEAMVHFPRSIEKALALAVVEFAPGIAEAASVRITMGDDAILSRSETARALGLSVRTLEDWASTGEGPAVVKITKGVKGAVGYRVGDVREFVRACRQSGMKPAVRK